MTTEKMEAPSVSDLDALQSRLEALQREEKEVSAKIKAINDAERGKVLVDVKALVQKFAFTSLEVFGKAKGADVPADTDSTKAKTAKPKVVMYKNEKGETWSGAKRGRRPDWVMAIFASGGDIEKYRVAD